MYDQPQRNESKPVAGATQNSHGYFVPPPRPQDNFRSTTNNNSSHPYQPSATTNFSHYDQSHNSTSQQPQPPQSPSSTVNVGNGCLQSTAYAPQDDQQHHQQYSQARPPPRPFATFQYSSQQPYPAENGSPPPPTNFYTPIPHNSHNPRNPSISPHTSPTLPDPPIPTAPSAPPNLSHLSGAGTRQPGNEYQSSFYNTQSMDVQNQRSYQYAPNQSQPYARNQMLQQQQQQSQRQHQQPQQLSQQPQHHSSPQQAIPSQQHQPIQAAVPFMVAGLQQMSNAANSAGMNHAALGAQLLQTFAPGAAGFTNQMIDQSQERVISFMRMPKYYFAVNHKYVLKKLSLILMPFMNRTWGRQRGLGPGNFDGASTDGSTFYLPPRDDVNAPDLYIPVMAFLSYGVVVGFVFGTRDAFQADVLAKYFSKGLGVLTMEVLIIKLGLYLINARPTPWLDVIAYRGYKFVGVVLTIVLGLVVPKLYVPALLYSATAMGIFLMRSHRRIILPRDMDMHESKDLARRNAFLLFVCVFQYPIYWILARVLSV